MHSWLSSYGVLQHYTQWWQLPGVPLCYPQSLLVSDVHRRPANLGFVFHLKSEVDWSGVTYLQGQYCHITIINMSHLWPTELSHRSTNTAMCVVRRSNNSFSDRCFAAAVPRLWSTLLVRLWKCDSLGQFKRLLKTHLFGVGTAALCYDFVRSAI